MLYRRRHDDRLNLSSNELRHPALPALLRAAATKLDAGQCWRYPDYHDGVARITRFLGVPTENMLVTPGTDAAIRALCRQYMAEATLGPQLIMQCPNYPAWQQEAALIGLTLVPVPLVKEPAGTAAMIKEMEKHQAALVAVSVPNGPLGLAPELDMLDTLVDCALAQGHQLVLDTCYQVFDHGFERLIRRYGKEVLIVQSLSKSHGLAGQRIGLVFGPADRIASLGEMRLEHAVSSTSLAMAAAMIRQHDALAKIWVDIRSGRDAAIARLRAEGCNVLTSRGNFVTCRMKDGPVGRVEASALVGLMSTRGYRIKQIGSMGDELNYIRFAASNRQLSLDVCSVLLDAWSVLRKN